MSVTARIRFGRKGPVRYLGHLDMMRYFQKAVLRSGIPAKYTEGFHPHQIMSFAYPLGVSMETEGDYMDLELTEEAAPEELVRRLNAVMREGIFVLSAVLLPEKAANAMASVAAADYRLEIVNGGGPDETPFPEAPLRSAAEKLLALSSITVGEKQKEIRPGIYALECEGSALRMCLSSGSRLNVRPADVWEFMTSLEDGLREAELIKIIRMEIYGETADGKRVPLDRLYEEA